MNFTRLLTIGSIMLLNACASNKPSPETVEFDARGKNIAVVSLFDRNMVLYYGADRFGDGSKSYQARYFQDADWGVANDLAREFTKSLNIGQKDVKDVTELSAELTSGFATSSGIVNQEYLNRILLIPEIKDYDYLIFVSRGNFSLPGTSAEILVPAGSVMISAGRTKGRFANGYGVITGSFPLSSIFMAVDIYVVEMLSKKTLVNKHVEKSLPIDVMREPDSGELKYLYKKIKVDFASEDYREKLKKIMQKEILSKIDRREILELYKKHSNATDEFEQERISFVESKLFPKDIPFHKANRIFQQDSTEFNLLFLQLTKAVVEDAIGVFVSDKKK